MRSYMQLDSAKCAVAVQHIPYRLLSDSVPKFVYEKVVCKCDYIFVIIRCLFKILRTALFSIGIIRSFEPFP